MLLIFDCDGVILDSMPLHNEVESAAYAKQGISITPQELARRFSGVPINAAIKILEEEHGCMISAGLELEMEEQKRKVFENRLQVMPDLVKILDLLKDVPRCIASGTRTKELDHALALVNLTSLFAPHIYSSQMVARGKPFPDLFLFAAEKVGQKPSQSVVIEDGIAGIEAAKAAGMRALGFTGGSHCDPEHGARLTAAGADSIFSSMLELPALIGLGATTA